MIEQKRNSDVLLKIILLKEIFIFFGGEKSMRTDSTSFQIFYSSTYNSNFYVRNKGHFSSRVNINSQKYTLRDCHAKFVNIISHEKESLTIDDSNLQEEYLKSQTYRFSLQILLSL